MEHNNDLLSAIFHLRNEAAHFKATGNGSQFLEDAIKNFDCIVYKMDLIKEVRKS